VENPCLKRRFPPPWTVDEANNACFIVRDKNGQALGYFYFEQGLQIFKSGYGTRTLKTKSWALLSGSRRHKDLKRRWMMVSATR
jgi:hypothetical protein